jgi:hypothetical protein
VFAAVRCTPTVPRINNDPELISQALQQFYNGKVGPTYSEPSTSWHNGHTKSFQNRLRTERLSRNHWTNLWQAPVMKPLQTPAPSPTRVFDAGLAARAEYVPEAGRPPTRSAAQSTESR